MKAFYVSCFVLFLHFVVNVCGQTQTDLNTLKSSYLLRWRSSNYKTAEGYMLSVESDGRWSNIDYTDTSRSAWQVSTHLQRVVLMAGVYTTPGSYLYNNATLLSKTLLALDWWQANNPLNPNWWFNEIDTPSNMGMSCLLLQPKLSATQITKCNSIIGRANINDPDFTGENLIWIGTATVYRGLLSNNLTLVTSSFKRMWEECEVFPGTSDGIKADGSFYQHGTQLYSGGYGNAFTGDILVLADVANGTAFKITDKALDATSLMVLDGQQWMINFRGRPVWDIPAKGREITRINGQSASGFKGWNLQGYSSKRSSEFAKLQAVAASKGASGSVVGNKAFWMTDYLVHSRLNYTASVKMYSTRTINNECVNSEGIKSLKLSDGANYVYINGDEYFNIFPVWDWERIPGITSEVGSTTLQCSTVTRKGKTSFVGSASNGIQGTAGFDFVAPFGSLTLKKAWFFFENQYVALGAGITTNSTNRVITSIDQRRRNGNVYLSTQPDTAASSGIKSQTDAKWLHHDSIGYIFPSSATLYAGYQDQTGKWEDIGSRVGTDTISVFSAYIEHASGGKVTDGDYEYIVVPGVSLNTFKSSVTGIQEKVHVLSNTKLVQSVYHDDQKQLQTVFYSPAVVDSKNGWTVSASKPCISMVTQTESGFISVVSDPTQKLTTLSITINADLKGSNCSSNGTHTTIQYKLPTGDYAGSSSSITCLNQNAPPPPTDSTPTEPSSTSNEPEPSDETDSDNTSNSQRIEQFLAFIMLFSALVFMI